MAKGYHKALAYKDEYEVARLIQKTRKLARAEFDGKLKLSYHMAPPSLSKKAADGRGEKREYGRGMIRGLWFLAKLKRLRGTPFDPFGYSKERRAERKLIRTYEKDLKRLAGGVSDAQMATAIALAELPLQIKGFGVVKQGNHERAMAEREQLLARLDHKPEPTLKAAE